MLVVLFLLFGLAAWAGDNGGKVEYVGGTVDGVKTGTDGVAFTNDKQTFVFSYKKSALKVAYTRINLIEYGQKVSRQYAAAILVSPMFMLAKTRKHFLTIGYTDEEGRQQAIVLRVDKNDIRSTLVSLEARTGLKIHYQDEEARKAGRG
jgi:hypothetical protein